MPTKHIEFTRTWTVQASPADVFPLLCPVREYDWLESWRCEIVHTESGVAEEDCIFRTELPGQGRMTWAVSRYEPPRAIEFTCFVPDSHVMRLKIALEPDGAATRLHWTRRFLSLGDRGDAWIAAFSPTAYESTMQKLEESLAHYLATGAMLRRGN